MEIRLDPNSDDIKISWRVGDGAYSRPFRVRIQDLHPRSEDVRSCLNSLNGYVGRNLSPQVNGGFRESKDPGWVEYLKVLKRLKESGSNLMYAFFNPREGKDRAESMRNAIYRLPDDEDLKIHCSDEQVTFPFGFFFDSEDGKSDPASRTDLPSRDDFRGFWVERFRMTMLLEGASYDSKSLRISVDSFKSLYTLHKGELEAIGGFVQEDLTKLKILASLELKDPVYSWADVMSRRKKIVGSNHAAFFFAHKRQNKLVLVGDDCLDTQKFADMFRFDAERAPVALLVMNCCTSVAGGEGASLLSAAAQPGVCGIIGTEAEIINVMAFRCGVRVMWEFVYEGLSIGEAFDMMQREKDLFPLNLLYTCYSHRELKLEKPMKLVMEV